MHSGGVHFSHTDEFLSGVSRPPRGQGRGMDGWIIANRRGGGVQNMTGGLHEEMGACAG